MPEPLPMDVLPANDSQVVDIPAALRSLVKYWLLIVGSMFWWGSHFLLLWNPGVASVDSWVAGYDSRFLLTVAGTLLSFAAVGFAGARNPGFNLSRNARFYGVFALVSASGLVMLIAPAVSRDYLLLGQCGAVLSGVGNSLAIVMYGELHFRMGLRYLPLAFSIEIVGGLILFSLFALLPMQFTLLLSAFLTVATSCCWFAFFRRSESEVPQSGASRVDLGLKTLILLAVLTGLGYGLVRTFAFGVADVSEMSQGLISECLGTCCSALLLVVVFVLQRRLSLFEICLLFVVPLVATGLLFVSLHGPIAIVPAVINQGGFSCFFALIWYFSAELYVAGAPGSLTRNLGILFFSSQLGQFVGALTPQSFANGLLTSLVYLILITAMLLLYWRSKRAQIAPIELSSSDGESCQAEDEQARLLAQWGAQYGLSPREGEIALLLIKRTPYRQVSEELFISENTVKTHVRNIYRKVDVSSREELLEVLNASRKKGESASD